MPVVGTRRSTRVCVPKTASSKAGDVEQAGAVVLRSGKRLVLSKPAGKKVEAGDGCGGEWLRLFGNSGESTEAPWWDGWGKPVASRDPSGDLARDGSRRSKREVGTKPLPDKRYRIVYVRKRRRSLLDGSDSRDAKGWRCSIPPFVRRQRRKISPLARYSLQIVESARSFAEKVGVFGPRRGSCIGGPMGLLVLVDSSDCGSLDQFGRFLVSTLDRMRGKKVRLLQFASFLLSESMAQVFSKHGVHFLPVQLDSYVSCRSAISGAGICGISGSPAFCLLVSLTFSALPFYFKSLHLSLLLGSRWHLGPALSRLASRLLPQAEMGAAEMEVVFPGSDDEDTCESMDLDLKACESVGPLETAMLESPSANKEDTVCTDEVARLGDNLPNGKSAHVGEDPYLVARSAGTNGLKFHRHQKKRSSLRSARVRTSSSNYCRNLLSSIHKSILKVNTAAKVSPVKHSLELVSMESDDHLSPKEDSSLSFPTMSNKNVAIPDHKKPVDTIKELKSILAELKQNIDSVCCKANILVVESDRCWREEGAQVMLELSDSNDWCLAVKVRDSIRYQHRPQEMRPTVTNRYTHAMIWSGENGWKLEFSNRMDWIMFKELHRECSERNSQDVVVRMIPVPGVRVIPGYEDTHSSFVRPDYYISTKYDEVERAHKSESAYYDLDSEDEQWLEQLNSNSQDGESSRSAYVSKDNFEKIIFAFEKAAYNNPDDVSDPDTAISSCLDLGKKDMVAAIFSYWLKKKARKGSALVRIFQESTRRTSTTQKPFLRKKRSFKRQGSHSGRGKPECYLQAGAKQEELRRVREAENAADKATAAAVQLRNRAQILMANADLAAYRSVLALKLAEAIQESQSSDMCASILG